MDVFWKQIFRKSIINKWIASSFLLAMTRSDAGAKPREGCDSVAGEIADQVRDDGKGSDVIR